LKLDVNNTVYSKKGAYKAPFEKDQFFNEGVFKKCLNNFTV